MVPARSAGTIVAEVNGPAVPPPPWPLAAEAVLWLDRGPSGVVVAGFVHYYDTPVGAYDEVLAVTLGRRGLRPAATVLFMAVDSEASLLAGRTCWGVPKVLAGFGRDGRRTTGYGITDRSWRISALARPLGPSVPVAAAGLLHQPLADGGAADSPLRVRGRVRPALVEVEVGSDGPPAELLRSGRRPGAVVTRVGAVLDEPGAG